MIDMPESIIEHLKDGSFGARIEDKATLIDALMNGTPLSKEHSFIAICDSDFPITEEVKQELKNTVFVGDENCNYCFDMTEIIEADKEN